jgi:4-amino-4-deoxy-L-arabinose transferase-like glycosyltransferase
MLVLKDWIIPHLNFVRLLDKPPMLYWLTALSFQLFGVSEFAARLPVVLSTLGCMMLCYLLGRRFFGGLAGLLAALIFVTCTGTVVFNTARQLQPDMFFSLFLTAALAAFLPGCFAPEKQKRYYLMGYAAIALAVMTKGLLGLVFPCLTLIAYLCLTRDFGMLKQLQLCQGAALFCLLTMPWHLAAELKSPGFLKFYLLDVHMLRFFDTGSLASNMTSLPLLAFWGMTVLLLYPWVVFLSAAGLRDFPGFLRALEEADQAVLWLWLWVGSVLIFFSLSSFRLYIYGLPSVPALAILGGRFWAKVFVALSPGQESKYRREILAATTLLVLVAGGILLAFVIPATWQQWFGRGFYGMVDTNVRGYDQGVISDAKVPSLPSWAELSSLGLLGGTVLTVGSLLAFLAAALNRLSWTFIFLILTMLPMRYCSQRGMEIFAPYISTKSLAATISATLQLGETIVKDGRYEDIGSVSFYTGQKIYLLHGIRQDLAFGSRYTEAAGTFLEEEEFLQLWNSERRVYLLTDYPFTHRPHREAFYGKLELYHLGSSGSMQLFTNHREG